MTLTDKPIFDGKQFRQALGTFATGVTIVTTRTTAGKDVGMTANSFNSVSLDPPMVLWSLAKTSGLVEAFVAAGHFGVHILADDQEELSTRFATRDIDRFEGLTLARGHDSIPLLELCAARFQCRTAYRYEAGDHIIFVGEVTDLEHFTRRPLLFHGGRYGRIMPQAKPDAMAEHEVPPGGFGPDTLSWLLMRGYFQILGRMRPALDRWGLDDDAFATLSVLTTRGPLRLTEIRDMVRFIGFRIEASTVAGLVAAGDLRANQDRPDDPILEVTAKGRRAMVELMALLQAIQAEAESGLDPSERALLHRLLGHVIRNTDLGVAAVWNIV